MMIIANLLLTSALIYGIFIAINKYTISAVRQYLIRIEVWFVFAGAVQGYLYASHFSFLWLVFIASIWLGVQTIRKSPTFFNGLKSVVITIGAAYIVHCLVYELFKSIHWFLGGILLFFVVLFVLYYFFPFLLDKGSGASSNSTRSQSTSEGKDEDLEKYRKFQNDAIQSGITQDIYHKKEEVNRRNAEIDEQISEIHQYKFVISNALDRTIDTTYSEQAKRGDIESAESSISDCNNKISRLQNHISRLENEIRDLETRLL